MTGANVNELYGTNLRVTVCANQGGRKYMEDRVHIHCERDSHGHIEYTFVAVYDGHGGSEASDYARAHLLENITSHKGFQSSNDQDILNAIKEGFMQTHQAMWNVVENWPRTASGYSSTAGTTASIAFIRNGKLYTGHVGDSAIVLGKRTHSGSNNMAGTRITVDHKPDTPEEKNRIEQAGGEVLSKAGVMRVVWTRTIRGHEGPVRRSTRQEKIPFLAVARALGDLWSYNSDLDDFIVSPEPDVDVKELGPNDLCLVLGSDGLWNVIRAQYSVDIVNAHEWKELEEQSTDYKEHLLDRASHSNHSRWMVRHALRGWGCLRADNVTVITVIFDPPTVTLPVASSCVLQTNRNMNIERVLTDTPEAMIRICPETVQVLKTSPVELVYTGAKDPMPPPGVIAHRVTLNFEGPGFAVHANEVTLRKRSAGAGNNCHNAGGLVRSASISAPGDEELDNTDDSDLEELPIPNGDIQQPNGDQKNNNKRRWTSNYLEQNGKEANEEGSMAKKRRSFYCTKHGLSCEKVKRLNSEAATNPSSPPAISNSLTGKQPSKHKYFCRRHGLTCEKVKKMNEDWAKSKAMENDSKPTIPLVTVTSPTPQKEAKQFGTPKTPSSVKKCANKSGLTDSTAKLVIGSKKKVSKKGTPTRRSITLGSHAITPPTTFHNTRQWSRVTRSGRHLSPVKSAPSLRNRHKAVIKRAVAVKRASSATPPQSPKRTISMSKKPLHEMTVQSKSMSALKSVVAIGPATRTRAFMEKLSKTNGTTESIHTRSSALFGGLNLETKVTTNGHSTRRFSSQLLACNISPRLLARSSITNDHYCPETNGPAASVLMKRKLFDSSDHQQSEPIPKRSRLWNLLSIFGGTAKTD